MRPIDADAIPYTMLYKEDWLKGTGAEKPGVWKNTIDAMPTIQPERKTGKWMVDPDGRLHCSRCLENPTNRVMIDGRLVYDMTPIVGKMKFCPNCGAEMKGDKDENKNS